MSAWMAYFVGTAAAKVAARFTRAFAAKAAPPLWTMTHTSRDAEVQYAQWSH